LTLIRAAPESRSIRHVKPVLSLIAALDENRLIGTDGRLPWKLPVDVEHFRRYTQGKWILVGRRTYEEMQGWFTDHTPLVLTSHGDYQVTGGGCTVAEVPEAIRLADAAEIDEVVCIGGGKVFAAALPHADKLVLTYVEGSFPQGERAAFFPKFDAAEWEVTESHVHPADERHAQGMRFEVLERKRAIE